MLLAVLAKSLHQEVMIEIVEQAPDVELYHPVMVPAPASGHGNRAKRRFSRTIAVGILAEDRIKVWLQPHLHRRLRNPVGNRRNAQYPDATCLLWNRHGLDRRWKVAAGAHAIPDQVQVVAQLPLELLDRLGVDPRRPLVGFHT